LRFALFTLRLYALCFKTKRMKVEKKEEEQEKEKGANTKVLSALS
jgi:hypothetical protein